MQSDFDIRKKEKIDTIIKGLRKIIDRMTNQNLPGSDLVLGFWVKKFRIFHESVKPQLQQCMVVLYPVA